MDDGKSHRRDQRRPLLAVRVETTQTTPSLLYSLSGWLEFTSHSFLDPHHLGSRQKLGRVDPTASRLTRMKQIFIS